MTRRRSSQLSYVMALVAVMLLSLAGVRSTVMQVEMSTARAGAMPECGVSRGMGGDRSHPDDASHKTCAFCAVAGHLPLCVPLPALPAPTVTAWLSWRAVAALGARGPPGFTPRARGPPDTPLTS